MKRIKLGKTGEMIPAVGIGTWKLGADRSGSIKAIRLGIDLGMRFVDTAEMYANEEVVGEAIKDHHTFIATKLSPSHFHEKAVEKACNDSIARLGVKAIDLYQLHWPNSGVPIKETMHAMERLVDQGKIHHIGVSNFNLEELEEAQAAMKRYEIASNQIEYSVFVRDFGDALFDYCKKEGITIIAYSPLARGAMFDEHYAKAYNVLESIAAKHGKTVGQVGLNWLVSKGNICAIPKAASPEHVKENAAASDWKMSIEEIMAIDELGQLKAPMAGSLNAFTKRTAPFWSGLLTGVEKRRMHSKKE